jgi:hypothetical protein
LHFEMEHGRLDEHYFHACLFRWFP